MPALPPSLALSLEGYEPFLLLGGLILITAWFMMRLARRNAGGGRGRGAAGDGAVTGAERLEKLRQQDGVRHDLESLMVEIEEMAKRLGHQLDAKALRLEGLLEEADRRLTRMKRLAERLEAATGRADGGSEGGHDATREASHAARAASPAPTGEAELTRSVYALADEGLAPPDIARRLDEHAGKVELILALRRP